MAAAAHPYINLADVSTAMSRVPQVHEVHSVHIWTLSSEMTALSTHVVLTDVQSWHAVLQDLRHMLQERFDRPHHSATGAQ